LGEGEFHGAHVSQVAFLSIAEQLLDTLNFVHSEGRLHGDVIFKIPEKWSLQKPHLTINVLLLQSVVYTKSTLFENLL
jgi:hypothetical protein